LTVAPPLELPAPPVVVAPPEELVPPVVVVPPEELAPPVVVAPPDAEAPPDTARPPEPDSGAPPLPPWPCPPDPPFPCVRAASAPASRGPPSALPWCAANVAMDSSPAQPKSSTVTSVEPAIIVLGALICPTYRVQFAALMEFARVSHRSIPKATEDQVRLVSPNCDGAPVREHAK
jgi:hypothetical protein